MKKPVAYYISHLCSSNYFFAALYVLIVLLYCTVSVQSFGYDDEFFNINLVERLGPGVIDRLQHTDVHPPLSYIINLILFKMFGSWTAVRAVSGLFISSTLILIINQQRKIFGNRYALVILLLLALNPAILMWCTGIRWYAYFLPVLLYLVFQPLHNGYRSWLIALSGLTVLAYTGYITFLIAVPVLLLYWVLSDDTAKNKLKYVFCLIPIFLGLYAYQLFVFLTVHLKYRGKETFSLIENLRGYFVSQISNQGIFPISVPAVLSVAGYSGILFCIAGYSARQAGKRQNLILAAYMLATILLIVSGVAGKPRNLILLIPFQVFLIGHYYSQLRTSMVYVSSVLLIGIANIWGCANVIRHENTIKNNWNLPVKTTIAEIEKLAGNDSSVLIFAYEPTLTHALQDNGFKVISLYNNKKLTETGSVKTVIFINTFRGSLNIAQYDSLISEERNILCSGKQVIRLGYDGFYKWKRKIISGYPEYQVELIVCRNPEKLNQLIFWKKKNIKQEEMAN